MNNNVEKLLPPTVNPTPINFGALPPDSSLPMPVLISNPNDKPIIWNADACGTTWLMLDEATSTGTLQPGGQKEINVTVKTSSMLSGSYTATITFTSDVNDESASVQVPVLLTVTTASNLVSARDLTFAVLPLIASLNFVRYLSSSQTLPLAITNWNSQNAVDWTADTGGTNWLTLDRWNGTLEANERQTIYVTANTNSLQLGDYVATLTLMTGGIKTPTQIQVELHVDVIPDGDNGPKAPIANPDPLDFDSPQLAGNTALLQITNPSNQNSSVSLSMNNNGLPWLRLNTIKGIILKPSDHYTVNVTIDKSGLLAGTYKTDLLPTFDFFPGRAGSHSTPTTVPVSMTVK